MRYQSINYLRGLAVLLVILEHWPNMFLKNINELLYTNIPIDQNAACNQVANADMKLRQFFSIFKITNFKFASGGVLLFFLISGFVIPISLEKYNPYEFLLRRIFRILPVIWISLFLILVITYVYKLQNILTYWPYSIKQVIHNMFLLQEVGGTPNIDQGLWTLLIEFKFYFLMAGVVIINRKVTIQSIITLSIILFTMSTAFFSNHDFNHFEYLIEFLNKNNMYKLYSILAIISNSFPYLIYMLIGSVIYLWFRKDISFIACLIVSIMLLYLYTVSFLSSVHGKFHLHFISDGVRMYIIFLISICIEKGANNKKFIQIFSKNKLIKKLQISIYIFKILSKVFSYLANISYPLYLIHGRFGMALILLFYFYTQNAEIAFFLGALIVFFVSHLVHVYIEMPGISLGKRISGQLFNINNSIKKKII